MKCLPFLAMMLVYTQIPAQSLTSEISPGGILINDGDVPVLHFQTETISRDGSYPRSNYVHPLYSLNGQVLTEDFPEDHPHHRGIFWTWHQVLIGDQAIGDAWACEAFSWDVQPHEPLLKADGAIELRLKTYWKSSLWKDYIGEEAPFLSEDTRITVHQRKENYRIIDFEIGLLALVPNLKIGGSDDEKGYGGFSVRVKLPEDIKFTAASGDITPTTNAIPAGAWMKISGTLTPGTKSGIIMMSHPENPSFPEPWILRSKRSMQNVAYPGRDPVEVSNRKALQLKYRLVVFQDHMSSEKIQSIFSNYE